MAAGAEFDSIKIKGQIEVTGFTKDGFLVKPSGSNYVVLVPFPDGWSIDPNTGKLVVGAQGTDLSGVTMKATSLSNGETPTATYDKATNTLTFGIPKGDKGEPGAPGSPGDPGAPAGFGTPTATAKSIAAGSTPKVTVSATGTDAAKVFNFAFEIPAPVAIGNDQFDGTFEDLTASTAYVIAFNASRPNKTIQINANTTVDIEDGSGQADMYIKMKFAGAFAVNFMDYAITIPTDKTEVTVHIKNAGTGDTPDFFITITGTK